jgi:GntR family transcriptional regulator, transcriptional repressor for pyruvate dehydrogenase complex
MESGYPDDLVELRLMFEPAAAVMAMERATPEDHEDIRRAVERLERAVALGKPTAEDDIAFHAAILNATKNPLVVRIGETIFQLFTPSINVSMQHIANRAIQDHRGIYDAFRSGDAERLRAAVLKSYDGWKESLYRNRNASQYPAKEHG